MMAFHSGVLQNLLTDLGIAGPEEEFAVALSGGADSLALLLALSECVPRDRIVALHFNHSIHADSATWVEHCRQTCEQNRIRFLSGKWSEENLLILQKEARAREARYRWFAEVMSLHQILLTGHHLDDQAETVLMNLAEGRSLERVAGIPAVRSLGFDDTRRVVRPLLGVRRVALQQYLLDRGTDWIEDPANLDSRYSRTLIRHEILPVLTARWPKAVESIGRLAGELADTIAMVNSMADEKIAACQRPQQATLFCRTAPLDLEALMTISEAQFNVVLRRWLHQGATSSPGRKQITEFYRQLSDVSSESHCQMTAGGCEIIYFNRYLFHIQRSSFVVDSLKICSPDQQRISPGLSVRYEEGHGGIAPEYFESATLLWRMRESGDRFTISSRSGSTSLKKVMQTRKLAPWLRQSLPILTCDKDVVWAHGVGVNARYRASNEGVTGKTPLFSMQAEEE